MSTEVGVAYVRLLPSAQGFGKAVSTGIDSQVKEAGDKAAKSLSDSFGAAGETLKKTGKWLTAGLTLPLVGLGTSVVTTAGDFQAAMQGVKAVTGATGEDFDSLALKAKELGSTTAFSASEAAAGMEFLGMAGWSTEQILTGLDSVLALAAAGGISLADAANIASNVMAGMGMSADEAAVAADALAKASASSNTDVLQLGEAASVAAGSANSAGWSIDQLAMAIGLFGNVGIQGETAGSGLTAMLNELQNPTSKAATLFSNLGIELRNAGGDIKGLDELMIELMNSEVESLDIVEAFGADHGPKLVSALGQGSEAVEKLQGDMDDMSGSAQEMADIRMEGLNGELKTLASAWEGLLIAIAESGLLDFVTGIVKKLSEFISTLSATNPELLKLGTIIAGVAAVAGPIIGAIGLMVSGIGKLIPSSLKLGGGLKGLAGGLRMLLGPWGILIGLIVAALVESEDFRNALMGLAKTLFAAAQQIFEALMPAFESLIKAILPVIVTIAEWLVPILEVLIDALVWVITKAIIPLVEWIISWLVPAFKFLADILIWLWNNVLVPVWNFLSSVFGPIFKAIGTVVMWLWENVFKPLGQWIKNTLGPIFKWLWENVLQPMWKFIKDKLIPVFKMLWEKLKEAFGKMVERISIVRTKISNHINKLKTIFERIGTFVKNARDAVKTRLDSIVTFVKNIPTKIKNGLSTLKDKFTAPFKGAFNAVANLWNSTVGQWSISIPDFVPGMGGKTWSMPKIPTFAKGGVIDPVRGGVLGVLAEAGVREYAIPEPDLHALIGDAKAAGANAGVGGGVVINAGGLDRALLEWLRSSVRTQGGGNVQVAFGRGGR